MANDETVKVRLPGALLERARRAAGPRGFSEFARLAIEEKLSREEQPQLGLGAVAAERASLGTPVVLTPTSGRRAPRREPCVHRISPAAFCKVCDG